MGSHKETTIPRFIKVDQTLAYCLGIYAAEGDTGFNGKNKPKKLRLTNTIFSIIKYFRDNYLFKKFKQKDIRYYVYLPLKKQINKKYWYKTFNTTKDRLHIYYDKQVTMPKIRISCERKIILDLTLQLIKIIKKISKNNQSLNVGYLQGLFDGEGTAYCKRMKYVRIEMKNLKEMKFVHKTLKLFKIKTKLKERRTRKGMYSLMISKYKNINNFNKNIGFKLVIHRQKIVKKILDYYSVRPNLTKKNTSLNRSNYSSSLRNNIWIYRNSINSIFN
jgi:hypothetical protein